MQKFVNVLIANTKEGGKEGGDFWAKVKTLLAEPLWPISFEGPEKEHNMNMPAEMIAICGGFGAWGVVNLLEGCSADLPTNLS